MGTKKFSRKKENFKCKVCGNYVTGTGYTDHCPNCLWSKHIDINPGDRKCRCRGLMEPTAVESKNSHLTIFYKCTKCGYTNKVKAAANDNKEELRRLSAFPH